MHLTKCKENITKAYFTIHKWSFKIDNSGLAKVRAHASNDGHKYIVKVISGTTAQRTTVISNGNKILVDIKKNILLSTEDQVIYAEPLQVLDCVPSNYSFTNANTNI